MRKAALLLGLTVIFAPPSPAQEKAPLRLVETVSVPGVTRHWDHFGVDLKGNRLLVTSEEDPAVEVFDLKTNKHIRALTDFKEPHNVVVFPELEKLFVIDGEASEIKILNYKSYELIGRVGLTIDADPVAYDAQSNLLYVVNGGREAHTSYCLISVVDAKSGKKLADMMLDTNRLESMAIENSSARLFVNMTGVNKIGVVDRSKRAVVATWPVTAGEQNVPMQYDEARHRLFVVTRKPSKLVVVNTDTGKEVTSLSVAEYADDLAYDSTHRRLYIACGGLQGGQGAISVVEQRDADSYQLIATVPTKPGAKTARLVPELNRYYVGAPGTPTDAPQILVFETVF